MKLPFHNVIRPSRRQRRDLADWLVERALDPMVEPPEFISPSSGQLRYDRTREPIRAGEIFLLRPAPDTVWGPTYVMALEQMTATTWRMAPFGRYATPAVPGEWKTGMAAVPLRVLCLWNVRAIRTELLLPGAARRIGAAKMHEVSLVYRHVMEGATVDSALAARLGPPIVHPADPRYEYLAEERGRLDDHLRSPSENRGTIPLEGEHRGPARWLLAAEGRPKWPSA